MIIPLCQQKILKTRKIYKDDKFLTLDKGLLIGRVDCDKVRSHSLAGRAGIQPCQLGVVKLITVSIEEYPVSVTFELSCKKKLSQKYDTDLSVTKLIIFFQIPGKLQTFFGVFNYCGIINIHVCQWKNNCKFFKGSMEM